MATGDLQIDGTLRVASTLSALAAAADGLSGIAEVDRSYVVKDDCDWLEGDLEKVYDREIEGHVAVWFTSATFGLLGGGPSSAAKYSAELLIKMPKDYSTYAGQALDLAENLANEWLDESNYDPTACEKVPSDISWRYVETRNVTDAGIAVYRYDITVRF